jgi:hypothetical protein
MLKRGICEEDVAKSAIPVRGVLADAFELHAAKALRSFVASAKTVRISNLADKT